MFDSAVPMNAATVIPLLEQVLQRKMPMQQVQHGTAVHCIGMHWGSLWIIGAMTLYAINIYM